MRNLGLGFGAGSEEIAPLVVNVILRRSIDVLAFLRIVAERRKRTDAVAAGGKDLHARHAVFIEGQPAMHLHQPW